jgi:hypothetical protein
MISFDRSLFIHPPSSEFQCPICLNIMNDPVSCPEGHTFCRHCVSKHLDAHAFEVRTCPTCRIPLSKDKLVPSRLICNLIDDLAVRCFSLQIAHEDRNQNFCFGDMCAWSGSLKDAQTHYGQCPHANATCPHSGCDEISVRYKLPEHMKNCDHRLVSCLWCQGGGKYYSHSLVCPKRPVPCPNGCLDGNGNTLLVSHNLVAHHRSVCLMEEVGCKFAVSGCDKRLLRRDMPLHEIDAGTHLVCLFEAHQRVLAQVRDQAEEIQNLKCSTDSIEISIKINVCELRDDKIVSRIPTTPNLLPRFMLG